MSNGTVELYTFEDAEGVEQTYTTFSADDAAETAMQNGWRVIANIYEWVEAEPVPQWDFTAAPEEHNE